MDDEKASIESFTELIVCKLTEGAGKFLKDNSIRKSRQRKLPTEVHDKMKNAKEAQVKWMCALEKATTEDEFKLVDKEYSKFKQEKIKKLATTIPEIPFHVIKTGAKSAILLSKNKICALLICSLLESRK